MATQPDFVPDTITPQSPPEAPAPSSPVEAPDVEGPGVITPAPDYDRPDTAPSETPLPSE